MNLNLTQQFVKHGDIKLNVNITGQGEPLLLIHGYPETHLGWYKLIPELAKNYTVICPDVRGNGASDKPAGDKVHVNYSKRALASDMIAIMDHLGFDQFNVIGHDRGARIVHRLCLDHPARVNKAVLLDIIPTRTLYENLTHDVAQTYFHWFFLTQPAPLPEKLLSSDPMHYLHWGLGARIGGIDSLEPSILKAFEDNFAQPDVIHATCEDYRAAATIDLEHDKADADKKITCPLLTVWGTLGPMGKMYDILATWQEKADNVIGLGLECGHYPAQEKPDELLKALADFF